MLPVSRSSGSLGRRAGGHAAPMSGGGPPAVGGGLVASHSLAEIPATASSSTAPRKAYSAQPMRWSPVASHGHPRLGAPPASVLSSWSEAAAEEHAEALVRFKGVLWVKGGPYGDRQVVLQGLFGHVEIEVPSLSLSLSLSLLLFVTLLTLLTPTLLVYPS